MSNYVVCAFYTDSYAAEVASLEVSVKRFGLDFYKEHYESRGYWEANTRIKPEFLLKCLDKFCGRDIVYLDADSVIRSAPLFFDSFEGDVGVYFAEADAFTHKFLTGTLYLKNSSVVKDFLRFWSSSQGSKATDVDQDGFQRAINTSPHLKVVPLPAGYTKIYDRDDMPGEVVIEHFQASRQRVKLSRVLKKLRNTLAGLLLLVLVILFLYSDLLSW